MKLNIVLISTAILLGLVTVQAAPGTNATCLQSCPPGGVYSPQCCNCCPGGNCLGNGAEFTTCCLKTQSFCGCASGRAFCNGFVYNGANQESPFGTCYASGTGVCSYNPSPNVWVLCPVGKTGCIGGNSFASCCSSDQTCNSFTGFCEAAAPPQCNGQNYDSAVYTCTINDQGQQVLCQNGFSSCGAACYQSSQYCCQNGQLRQAGQCSAQTSQQTSQQTSAQTSATLPPATTGSQPSTCNGQAYDKTNYDCPTNDQGQQVLCPKGNSACGSACYQASQYCCQNGQLRQAGQCSAQTSQQTSQQTSRQTSAQTSATLPPATTGSQPSTCNGQAYDKTNYDCPINDQGAQVLCPKGNSACGSACYQSSQYCCQSGQLRQAGQCSAAPSTSSGSGSLTCASGEVYNPSTSYCCQSVSYDKSPIVCPIGQHCCGNILNGSYTGPESLYKQCYDPTKSQCCYGGTSAFLNPSTIKPITYVIPTQNFAEQCTA